MDLVEDLSGRLRSLRQQVAKATRYRRLRTEVRQGEVYLGLARYAGLAGDRRVLGERLRAATQTEETKRKELERYDADIESHRETVDLLDSALGGLRDELAEMEASRREQESARMYQGRESEQLRERIQRLSADREQAQRDLMRVWFAFRMTREHDEIAASAQTIRSDAEQAEQIAETAEVAVSKRRKEIEETKTSVLMVRQLARIARIARPVDRPRDIQDRIADVSFRIRWRRTQSPIMRRRWGSQNLGRFCD